MPQFFMKARHSRSLPCECGVLSPDELGVLGGDVQRSKLEPEPKKNCDSDSLHKRKGLKHEEVFCKYLRHHLS